MLLAARDAGMSSRRADERTRAPRFYRRESAPKMIRYRLCSLISPLDWTIVLCSSSLACSAARGNREISISKFVAGEGDVGIEISACRLSATSRCLVFDIGHHGSSGLFLSCFRAISRASSALLVDCARAAFKYGKRRKRTRKRTGMTRFAGHTRG